MNHSPEPWKYIECMTQSGQNARYSELGGIVDANGSPICWFGNSEQYYPTNGDEPSPEDMGRILACVNLLAGIPEENFPIVKAILDGRKLDREGG